MLNAISYEQDKTEAIASQWIFNNEATEGRWEVVFSPCDVLDAVLGNLSSFCHLIFTSALEIVVLQPYRCGGPQMLTALPKVVKLWF